MPINERVLKSSACAVLAAIGLAWPASAENAIRDGAAAYGDFETDAPGLIRKITPADLPKPLATPSTANRSKVVEKPAGASLKTMPGFEVAAFASGLKGARVLRVAPNGDIFVAQSKPDGKITILRAKDGAARPDSIETYTSGLNQPFGMAFYPPGPEPRWLYIAENTRVVRFAYKNGDVKPAGEPEVVITGIPTGGHWTRDIAFSPDGKTLYLSVGSGSNVAEDLPPAPADLAAWEKSHAVGATWGREEYRADVLAYDPDGNNRRIYADGIRNCSGLTIQPGTGALFCATNERDLLGNNLPPDYVTRIKEGAFYGWPWYYIGDHEDPRHAGQRPDLAGKVTVPDVLFQPHSAPLGVAFDTGTQFPADWKGDAFVALHGSWNRDLHTGYKIVRLPFKDGQPTGESQDFVIGFGIDRETVWGRPVYVTFAHDGALLFSDDDGGVVWRVAYKGK